MACFSLAAFMTQVIMVLWIKKGTRIGQYISFEAEALSSYDGDYGINKQHDQKYGVK